MGRILFGITTLNWLWYFLLIISLNWLLGLFQNFITIIYLLRILLWIIPNNLLWILLRITTNNLVLRNNLLLITHLRVLINHRSILLVILMRIHLWNMLIWLLLLWCLSSLLVIVIGIFTILRFFS